MTQKTQLLNIVSLKEQERKKGRVWILLALFLAWKKVKECLVAILDLLSKVD